MSPTADQVTRARALVAAELGMATLDAHQVVEQGSVGSGGVIHLTQPASALGALTLNGVPATGVLLSPTAIDVSGAFRSVYGQPWGSGYGRATYAVTYTAGWAEGAEPEPITQAVAMTAEGLEAGALRGDVTSEQMGPVKYTYATAAAGLADAARALLAPYRAITL